MTEAVIQSPWALTKTLLSTVTQLSPKKSVWAAGPPYDRPSLRLLQVCPLCLLLSLPQCQARRCT